MTDFADIIATGLAPADIGALPDTPSGVTPGSYTNANVTVDSRGRVTTASSGTAVLAVLRQTVTQTLTTGTLTPITLDVEDIDTNNGHSTSANTSRYTAQTAGWYAVSGAVVFLSNGTGRRLADLAVNGTAVENSRVEAANAGAAGDTVVPIPTRHVHLNVGDYVEIRGFQTSGGNLNTQYASGGVGSWLCVEWRHS